MTVEHDPAKTAPHQADDKPVPTWQKWTALAFVVATFLVVVVFRGRLSADFYPLDASRVAPNILASLIQYAVILIAAALIWPPTRRRLHRFVDAKLAPVHEHLAVLRQHHEDSAERQRLILRQNAHIIRHNPNLDNVAHDGTNLTEIPDHL